MVHCILLYLSLGLPLYFTCTIWHHVPQWVGCIALCKTLLKNLDATPVYYYSRLDTVYCANKAKELTAERDGWETAQNKRIAQHYMYMRPENAPHISYNQCEWKTRKGIINSPYMSSLPLVLYMVWVCTLSLYAVFEAEIWQPVPIGAILFSQSALWPIQLGILVQLL